MDRDPNASPFLDVPPVVVALAMVIMGLEALFSLAGSGIIGDAQGLGWRIAAIQDWGVIDGVFAWMWDNQTYPLRQIARLFSYPLLHVTFTHAALAAVFVLAIGKAISGLFSAWKFVLVFWAASVGGALIFVTLLDSPMPLVGGYPGAYGLIGCFTFILWVKARMEGDMPIRAFQLIGFLMAIQLVFGALLGSGGEWVADLAGFFIGFGLAFVLVPGGARRLLDKLRQR